MQLEKKLAMELFDQFAQRNEIDKPDLKNYLKSDMVAFAEFLLTEPNLLLNASMEVYNNLSFENKKWHIKERSILLASRFAGKFTEDFLRKKMNLPKIKI
jgi:hypothetical protein